MSAPENVITHERKRVRLFISHSERDRALVVPLVGWLEHGLGLKPDEILCTSITNMPTGALAAEALRKDIVSSEAVIGLLTSNSLNSLWAQLEMGAGWLKKQLKPIRGPGINVEDLPSPLDDFATVSYCEIDQMQGLLNDLALTLGVGVQHAAKRDLTRMAKSAEQMLVTEMALWFSLPPVLSAWRINETHYNYALESLCSDLDLDIKEIRMCATRTGTLNRDPDGLPCWAEDLWLISKNVVNAILSPPAESREGDLDGRPGVLNHRLNADIKRVLKSDEDRPQRVRAWFGHAVDWITSNPPSANRGHSPVAHRRR